MHVFDVTPPILFLLEQLNNCVLLAEVYTCVFNSTNSSLQICRRQWTFMVTGLMRVNQ